MRRASIPYHGVRLRRAPFAYECPYCLHPVGLFGNLLLKMFGRAAHGCPRTNVLTAEEITAELAGPAPDDIDPRHSGATRSGEPGTHG